ncbi:MAG: DUF488 domain-containing protein [Proteobacteria bacterium]|nr:MAG: DUF488 domain-containing protein [Pseudomonadota bacterium]
MQIAKQLYTIGYEGQTLESFLSRLLSIGIDTLVDVRELPLSRKRGFSKNALARALDSNGIEYVHIPELGCPKRVRDLYKINGNWSEYLSSFNAHLLQQEEALMSLAEFSRRKSAALMCFEANFMRCHRTIVARAAAKAASTELLHITQETIVPDSAHP